VTPDVLPPAQAASLRRVGAAALVRLCAEIQTLCDAGAAAGAAGAAGAGNGAVGTAGAAAAGSSARLRRLAGFIQGLAAAPAARHLLAVELMPAAPAALAAAAGAGPGAPPPAGPPPPAADVAATAAAWAAAALAAVPSFAPGAAAPGAPPRPDADALTLDVLRGSAAPGHHACASRLIAASLRHLAAAAPEALGDVVSLLLVLLYEAELKASFTLHFLDGYTSALATAAPAGAHLLAVTPDAASIWTVRRDRPASRCAPAGAAVASALV